MRISKVFEARQTKNISRSKQLEYLETFTEYKSDRMHKMRASVIFGKFRQ